MELTSCRICFSVEKPKLLSLFSVKIEEKTLADIVNFLSLIDIIQGDNLPEMICIECLNNVTSACETKRKCIDSDRLLRAAIPKPAESPCETDDPRRELNSENKTDDSLKVESSLVAKDIVNSFSNSEVIEDLVDISEDRIEDVRQTRRSKRVLKDIKKLSISPEKQKKISTQQSKKCCEKGFKKGLELSNDTQLKQDKDLREFCCDLCSFTSKRKKNVERHILAVHLKSFKFVCPINECKRQYTTQAALKLHCVRDHDESSPFECEKCSQKFSCESLLKIHSQRLSCRPRKHKIVEKKDFEKVFLCQHCEFKTAHKFSLTQHVNLIHLNIRKTWKCNHCNDSEFNSRISLNLHTFKFHNMSHIRCFDCNQAFLSEAQLSEHKKSLKCNARKATDNDYEESESGVKCKLCNRSYRTKKEWITHYFNHHKFNKVCDICNAQLSTYASLKNHKKTIHEKIKAFACTECPKRFSAKHTLEFHLNSHSGIKPYSCKWCPFKASDRSSVSKHQKKLHPGMN